MASFAEFVAEEFRSDVNLTWNLTSRSLVTAAFTVSSVSVVVSFEQKGPADPWRVSFEVQRGESSERTHLAFHIFNGVFQAVREFIEVREPEIVAFSTKRDELASVYQTYLRREEDTLRHLGYQLEPPQRAEPFVEFILRRVAPSRWRS
jgi:hypothetical protein